MNFCCLRKDDEIGEEEHAEENNDTRGDQNGKEYDRGIDLYRFRGDTLQSFGFV